MPGFLLSSPFSHLIFPPPWVTCKRPVNFPDLESAGYDDSMILIPSRVSHSLYCLVVRLAAVATLLSSWPNGHLAIRWLNYVYKRNKREAKILAFVSPIHLLRWTQQFSSRSLQWAVTPTRVYTQAPITTTTEKDYRHARDHWKVFRKNSPSTPFKDTLLNPTGSKESPRVMKAVRR